MVYGRFLGNAVVGLLLLGDARAAAAPSKSPPGLAMVAERVDPKNPTQAPQIILPGDLLCSGDSFQLQVSAPGRPLVYLLSAPHRSRDLAKEPITLVEPPPERDPVRLTPGQWHTLPPSGPLTLDDHTGVKGRPN